MSPDLRTGITINLPSEPELQLFPADQAWLASFGVDPAWQNNPEIVSELSRVITTGSKRLDEPDNQTVEAHTEIMVAREQFIRFVGIPDETMRTFRVESPTIIPLDTFIGSQRTITELGLDAAKVINSLPAAISYAPESVKAKFNNLTELGLDAAKVINTLPAAIGLAPESVKAKFDSLTELGLDAAKVINTHPTAIGYAPESVKAKFNNLTELGLDAAKVINSHPTAIGLAPESVKVKMKFLERSAQILNWQYSAQDLVETFPAILGFNKQKLQILRRIIAYNIDESSRSANPKQVRTSLITPLEKYVLALSNQGAGDTSRSLTDLLKEASRLKLDAKTRREQALAVAPNLGRIGTMYLRYRNQ